MLGDLLSEWASYAPSAAAVGWLLLYLSQYSGLYSTKFNGVEADAFEGSSISRILLFDTKAMEALYNENMLRQSTPTILSIQLGGNFRNSRFRDNIFARASELRNLHLDARGVEYNCRLFKGLKWVHRAFPDASYEGNCAADCVPCLTGSWQGLISSSTTAKMESRTCRTVRFVHSRAPQHNVTAENFTSGGEFCTKI